MVSQAASMKVEIIKRRKKPRYGQASSFFLMLSTLISQWQLPCKNIRATDVPVYKKKDALSPCFIFWVEKQAYDQLASVWSPENTKISRWILLATVPPKNAHGLEKVSTNAWNSVWRSLLFVRQNVNDSSARQLLLQYRQAHWTNTVCKGRAFTTPTLSWHSS